MDIFKLAPRQISAYLITKNDFEMKTKKEKPYYNETLSNNGEMRHFAVCPACDNPIEIIRLRDGVKPYGKHFKKTVYRSTVNQLSLDILKLLVLQLDRVVYLLEKDIGIKISSKLAIDMLENYLAERAYLYKYSSLHNIPWMFAYFANSHSLFYRIIHKNEALKRTIITQTSLTLDKYNKVINETDQFAKLIWFLTKHTVKHEDHKFIESLDFIVSFNEKNIYKQRIEFNTQYFNNLINQKGNDDKRDYQLLKVANELYLAHLKRFNLYSYCVNNN
ncbi:hypothetical protein PT276_01960 [Orbaceae bacterium ESL0721]|nr:hypothetical protein [Orbaceae bacterium ESL0721]